MNAADAWGALTPFYKAVGTTQHFLYEAYSTTVESKRFMDELPLTHHKWQVSFVEAENNILVILNFQPPIGTFAATYDAYPQVRFPELSGMHDALEIAAFLRLGRVIASRIFPFDKSAPDSQVADWASSWGVELAREHMARLHPSFEEAKRRMTEAYAMLFELEHALRQFVDAALSTRYKTKKWLLKACEDSAYQETIQARKQEERHTWLDVLDDSETRFLDFDHIRQLIHANDVAFIEMIPDVAQRKRLKRLLEDLKDLRNRVGHVNTLSSDDEADFTRMAQRVLAIIQPQFPARGPF